MGISPLAYPVISEDISIVRLAQKSRKRGIMQRPIKFRAWSKFNKRWLAWGEWKNHYYFDDNENFVLHNNAEEDDAVFLQFTDLHDKNGTEIYEGDIVRGLNWNKGMVKEVNMHSFCGWPNVPTDRFEVIGNIWPNPELLETK